jgi:hypothetical protein
MHYWRRTNFIAPTFWGSVFGAFRHLVGTLTGAADTTKSAIADACEGLKSLIKKKFGHDSDADEAIDKVEAKPESDGRK